MIAVTTAYVYPAASASFVAFGNEKVVGCVYGITRMDNGYTYINSAEYPFHYELKDTVVTVNDNGTAHTEYTTEVE